MVAPGDDIDTQKLVQNAAMCMLIGASMYQHIATMQRELYWLLIFFHAQDMMLVLTRLSEGPSSSICTCMCTVLLGEAPLHVPAAAVVWLV